MFKFEQPPLGGEKSEAADPEELEEKDEFETKLKPGERKKIEELRRKLGEEAISQKRRILQWSDEQLLEMVREQEGRDQNQEMQRSEDSSSGEKPKIEDDAKYKEILERHALIYLRTEDKKWFDREFSGVSSDGYLLGKDGKETNFLPSQSIGKDFDKVQREAMWEFASTHPEEAKKYRIDIKEEQEKEKKRREEAAEGAEKL